MEANRFNKVRSWLTTSKVMRQDVMKSYNFSGYAYPDGWSAHPIARIEGWWISIPRGKLWFSRRRLMCASVGKGGYAPNPKRAGRQAPFLDRPVIRQRIEIRGRRRPR